MGPKHLLSKTPEDGFAINCGSQAGDPINMTFAVDTNRATEARLEGKTISNVRPTPIGFQVSAKFDTVPDGLLLDPGGYLCIYDKNLGTVMFLG